MNILLITQYIISVLKQLPIDNKRKIALIVLEKFLKHLNGEQTDSPTKDELKVTVDAIKEIKQNNARSIQEYNLIENQAEFIKNLIDWGASR